MTTFLSQLAQTLVADHPDLRKLCIVLPSRRAAVFLRKELAAVIAGPVWLPRITTSEDFVMEHLNWELADQPTLLFRLYEAYERTVPEPRDSFAEFNHWAQLLLADFNEIDRYLVDYKQLFSYLADVERIKRWDLRGGELTDLIAGYLKLWEQLPSIYDEFTSHLKDEGRVYQGMAYRAFHGRLNEIVDEIQTQGIQLIFAGFNALNQAEEEIFRRFYRESLARFYWDVDRYYFHDRNQEAGSFLRGSKLVEELLEKDDFHWLSDHLLTSPKRIRVVGANGDQQQSIVANKLIGEYSHEDQREIALVLADEKLLPAFLNNLSSYIGSLNITMGLPLEETSMAGFFEVLLNMMRDQEQNGRRDERGNPAFHHRHWTDLLGNNLMPVWAERGSGLYELQKAITTYNRIFVSADDLEEWQPGIIGQELADFFRKISRSSLPEAWSMLAELARSLFLKSDRRAELPQPFFAFFRIFNRLSELMSEFPYVQDWQTALRFYRELTGSESLDLKGDPLSGLQIMGMLETRTLDFRKLIITSLNEDVLPKGRSENSLIPFEIRSEFGLPTYLDKDAVFAYHFYRLLQRADDICLIYNNAADGLHAGEPSRFIRQLQFELEERNPSVKIEELSYDFTVGQNEEEMIEKTPGVMDALSNLAEKGISPTALIDYINDQTEFYRKRVLRLQEADEVEEVAGYDTQGNVVHRLLEHFYLELPADNNGVRRPSPDLPVYQQSREELRQAVEESLRTESGQMEFSEGKNLVIREILTGMIQRFLRVEKEELLKLQEEGSELDLIGLEENFSASIDLSNGTRVKIHGNIDRIDRVSGQVRIIDYKTGSVYDSQLRPKSLDVLRQPSDGNKSLQLMVYSWLYMKNNPELDNIQAGIISLRNTGGWIIPLKLMNSTSITREVIEEFELFLKQLLEEIFDPLKAFEKNPVTLQSDE